MLVYDCVCVVEFDIDVFVNNVGVGEVGVLVDLLVEIVCVLFDVNVFGLFEFMQQIVCGMFVCWYGKIVFVLLIVGLIMGLFMGVYCVLKYVIELVVEVMYVEFVLYGICVVVVNFGLYCMGFNDWMMEMMWCWYDLVVYIVMFEWLMFLFEQYDLEEMVVKMVDVIDGDGGVFCNLLLVVLEVFVCVEQVCVWEWQQ